MTTVAQEILNTFDSLPDSERLEIALEILRRLVHFDFPPLTDEDLVLNAEELFLALDRPKQEFQNNVNTGTEGLEPSSTQNRNLVLYPLSYVPSIQTIF